MFPLRGDWIWWLVWALLSPVFDVFATVTSGDEESSAGARHSDWSPVMITFPRSALPEEVWVRVGVKPGAVSHDVAVGWATR